MLEPILELRALTKSYHTGKKNQINVLSGANLKLNKGEIVGLIAPSGAGKSTLLHIAGLLDRPDSGKIILNNATLNLESDARRTIIRRREIGFIYQFHHLLPEFTSAENIMIPQMANGADKSNAYRRAVELLSKVGLEKRINHKPAELSGGEQQRVAFCRALANKPKILLADEPTGNLDQTMSHQVFDTLISIARETQLSALIATHNKDIARRMDRRINLDQGQLLDD